MSYNFNNISNFPCSKYKCTENNYSIPMKLYCTVFKTFAKIKTVECPLLIYKIEQCIIAEIKTLVNKLKKTGLIARNAVPRAMWRSLQRGKQKKNDT